MPPEVPQESSRSLGSCLQPHSGSSVLCLQGPLWALLRASTDLFPLPASLGVSVDGLRKQLSQEL